MSARRCALTSLLVAMALHRAPWAAAQNNVPNFDFQGDVSGWQGTIPYGSIVWSSDDALALGTSGSAEVRNANGGLAAGAASDCFLTPNGLHVLSFDARVPSQVSSGQATLQLNTYSSLASCLGNVQAGSGGGSVSSGSWTHRRVYVGGGPQGYGRIFLSANKTSADGYTFSVRFDNIGVCYYDGKGDFDTDFFTDLLLRDNGSGTTYAWRMSDGTRLEELALSPQPPSTLFFDIVGSDDFNRDSHSDLVFQKYDNTVSFWMMNGATRVSTAALTGAAPPSSEWTIAATGDFTRDLDPDLLWRNVVTQKLMIWKLNQTAYAATIVPTPDQAVDANWRVVATLDYNNDGNRDLLWYNDTTGKIVFWFMDQNVVRLSGQFAVPPNAGDANWKVVAGGDYGSVAGAPPCANDIIWRNDTTGKLVIWYMDYTGRRVAGAFLTPDAPSPNPAGWTVLGPK